MAEDKKDETWRIKNEKRFNPPKDGGIRRRRKSDAKKIADNEARDDLVQKMRRRMR